MSVVAKLHYLRIAPRKVRLVADLIRGKTAEEAQTILNFTIKRAAKPLLKLLNQAIANAKQQELEKANLYISKITVDEGPKYKRWMPRARGQVSEIQKKTSHVTIVLEEIKKKPKKKIKKEIKRIEKVKEKVPKPTVPAPPKPKPPIEVPRPKIEKGIKRIFRRKAF